MKRLLLHPRIAQSAKVAALCVLAISFAHSLLIAQDVPQDRQYEFVLTTGQSFPAFANDSTQIPVSEFSLYAYHSGAWNAIPFQIDERTSGGDYFATDDGFLDANDEIVFMIMDAGDMAPPDYWPPEGSLRNNPRYEIGLTDPITGGQAYVYLFRNSSPGIGPPLPEYISYTPGPVNKAAADTITGISYVQAHEKKAGVPSYIAIRPSFGGTGTNFIDRLKLRVRGVVTILGQKITINVNEQDNLTATGAVHVAMGRVRLIRRVFENIEVFGQNFDNLPIDLFFYPFSSQLTGRLTLPTEISTQLLRLSLDFNGNAYDAEWHNQNVGPVIITGNGAGIPAGGAATVFLPQTNWFAMFSPHGGVMGIFSFDQIPGSMQAFYYWDTPLPEPYGTGDTGDGVSIGDGGFIITGNSLQGVFDLGMRLFMVSPDFSRDQAFALNANIEQPVTPAFAVQPFRLLAVNDLHVAGSAPESVQLAWTAPSDGGSSAGNYEIAFSTTPVGTDTAQWFDTIAEKAANPPAPGTPGSIESVTLSGLTGGERYYFMMRYFDAFSNPSELSNVASFDVVPVELVVFTASAEQAQITLSWRTASETNNLGFYIERRDDAESTWDEIGFVAGNGTTTDPQTYAYVDAELQPGTYRYRLRQVDFDGSVDYSGEIEVAVAMPQQFVLAHSYPNPFSLASHTNTTIKFELTNAEPLRVELRIYDILGREIRRLVDDTRRGGFYEVRWDGRQENGQRAATGIYLYELRAGDQRALRKLMLVR